MSNLYRFLICVLCGFVGYFGLYAALDKPLTDGELERLYEMKLGLLGAPGSHRLFVLAGSNGRFSHSCEVLELELGRPCANLSIAAGVGLDFIFSSFLPGLHSGDTVYMPLEFEQYALDKQQVYSGPDNAMLAKRYRQVLSQLGLEREIRAAFFADEKYFIHAIVETVLAKKGVQRRFNEASVNSHGDQQGHTEELGKQYADSIAEQAQEVPDLMKEAQHSFASDVIKRFLHDAAAKGVHVVGGLPTTFADTKIPDGTLVFLKKLYESEHQSFLVLDDKSQYVRSCFFDIAYHLNSSCQAEHSRLLANALRAVGA